MEAEDEKIKQLRVIDQFSKLIDLGTKKAPKTVGEVQTEISLSNLYPFEFCKGPFLPEQHSSSEFI